MPIRLCYASTRIEGDHDLLDDLSDILAKARSFNEAHHIYGVLYYAQGVYFQCLEGEPEHVEALFLKIAQDPRHHQIYRFPDSNIDSIHFVEWSMKYVNQHGKVRKFFASRGLSQFLPHALGLEHLDDFLELLLKIHSTDQLKETRKKGLNHRGYQNIF